MKFKNNINWTQVRLRQIENQYKEIEEVQQCLGREVENQNRERENAMNDVYRVLDSRLDKLESKITTSRKA